LKVRVAVDDSVFNPVIEAISGAANILSLIWVRVSRSARVILARMFFVPIREVDYADIKNGLAR
jgi:hypothetical protein